MKPLQTIQHVFQQLESYYGDFDWWPNNNPFEVMVGAILVQNTNWRNVDKALANLPSPLEPSQIDDIPLNELAILIRPSGYYNQKAIKIKALTTWLRTYHYDLGAFQHRKRQSLRVELLEIKGVGNETADVILTYALNKPSFVIDTYARRIFTQYGLEVPKNYDHFRQLAEQALPSSQHKYGYFHGLMVEHGQQFCNKTPKCAGCPLESTCAKHLA
ncbi:endonuclease [Vibrio sp. FNV 38]|nr:endonuclease [Vibrio sp. FNV 38]